METKISILFVDDEDVLRKALTRGLRDEHFAVTAVAGGREAIAALQQGHYDLVLTDLIMPEVDGFEVLKAAKKLAPLTCVLILTGYGDVHSAITALRLGADDFTHKPCDIEELVFRIRRCFEKRCLLLERKRSEEALQVSEGKFRSLAESNSDYIIRYDRHCRPTYMNPAALKIAGRTEAEVIGKPLRESGFPEELSLYCEEKITRVFAAGTSHQEELVWNSPHGAVYLDWRLTPEYDSEGLVQSVLGVSRDNTERRNALLNYQTIFAEMIDGFAIHEIICDEEGQPVDYRFLAVNPAFERMTGLKAANIIGRTILEVMPETEKHWIASYGRVALTGEPIHFENVAGDLEKHFKVAAFQAAPNQFACTFIDITERKRAEEEIQRNQSRLQKMVDILQHPSKTAQELLDYSLEQAIQLTDSKIGYLYHYHEDRKEMVLNSWSKDVLPACAITNPQTCYELDKTGIWGEAIRQRRPLILNDFQAAHPLKKGLPLGHVQLFKFATIPIFKGEQIVGVVGLGNKKADYDQTDILQISLLMDAVWKVTDNIRSEAMNLKLENQLRQAQKMEAIGTLAGGIAHDFNNILGAILGYAEMAKEAIPAGSDIAHDLDKVLEAGGRAANLVKQILAFSRQASTERIPLQPVSIVKETAKLLRPALPSTITIRLQFKDSTRSILGEPTQIHQIVMNLCTNAFHAMEQTGGILEIALKDRDLTREELRHRPEVQPGKFLELSIADTGPGIAPAIRDKIFEPYFTTKELGKGTGLGLAIVHGIVAASGGFVTCESELGKGTIFHVFFPAVDVQAAAETEQVDLDLSGRGRILLIDDEAILVEMGQAMLERLGYEVTARTSSLEALLTFQNQPNMFDAVITDQTMPAMTGIDLARRMLQIRADIPIILCTGYSSLINEEQARAYGIKAFAAKPLAKKELAMLLRKVLDKGTLPSQEPVGFASAMPRGT